MENDQSARREVSCPACAEFILESARKCKHCGEWLAAADAELAIPDTQAEIVQHKDDALHQTKIIITRPSSLQGSLIPWTFLLPEGEVAAITNGQTQTFFLPEGIHTFDADPSKKGIFHPEFKSYTIDTTSLSELHLEIFGSTEILKFVVRLRETSRKMRPGIEFAQQIRTPIRHTDGETRAGKSGSNTFPPIHTIEQKQDQTKPQRSHTAFKIAITGVAFFAVLVGIDNVIDGVTGASSSSAGTPSCVPADADTRTSSSSCSVRSMDLSDGYATVVLSVRGFSPGDGFVSCTAFNSDGQRVGGDRKSWSMGRRDELVKLFFSTVESPARVTCQYRLFNY
jgi:hypothetical protein